MARLDEDDICAGQLGLQVVADVVFLFRSVFNVVVRGDFVALGPQQLVHLGKGK